MNLDINLKNYEMYTIVTIKIIHKIFLLNYIKSNKQDLKQIERNFFNFFAEEKFD